MSLAHVNIHDPLCSGLCGMLHVLIRNCEQDAVPITQERNGVLQFTMFLLNLRCPAVPLSKRSVGITRFGRTVNIFESFVGPPWVY